MGFTDGLIFIYDCLNPTKTVKICECPWKGKRHTKAIEQLIWNEEGNQLNTVSTDNLLFYETGFNQAQQREELTITRNVKESDWKGIGRFGWKTCKMWGQCNTVTEVVKVAETYTSLFAITEEGSIRAYKNPSGLVFQDL